MMMETARSDQTTSVYSTASYESDEDEDEEDSSAFDKLPDFQQQIEQIE